MTYIGAFLVIFAVFAVWRVYCVFLGEQINSTRAFLAAISDYREKMRCYLKSPSEWAKEYCDERLSGCGFLSRVADGETLSAAYRDSRGACYLTKRSDEAIDSCFAHLGEGYLDTELEVVESAIEKLKSEESSLSRELGKRKKVVGAMLGAFATGIVILAI